MGYKKGTAEIQPRIATPYIPKATLAQDTLEINHFLTNAKKSLQTR
jgi:hypothetical protein